MANVLNKTADPADYRSSVHTPDYPSADWFRNPDLSAVAAVPSKYWKRPLTDPVAEMSQAEKDAVDAAEAAAEVAAQKQEALDLTGGGGVGTRRILRAAFETIIDAIQSGQLAQGTTRTVEQLETVVRTKINEA